MRRFSFLAVLILGFLVVVAPSAYGDAVVKLVIESGIEGIVSIEGVTGIAVTMDEPADGETWGVGLSAVDDDFYGIPILAVVDEGADWTGNGWSGGEITWTGTSPILSGGTLEMWGWADDTPIASITDVVVTGYVGTVTWSVAEAADQPWAPDDTIYELTITFTPGAGAMTAIFTGEGDEVEIPTTPISGAGTVVYDADSINFTSTQGESTTWALPAPSGSGAGDFTYVMELAMDEMTEVPGWWDQVIQVTFGDGADNSASVGLVQWGYQVECRTISAQALGGAIVFDYESEDCTEGSLGDLTATVGGDASLRIMLVGDTLTGSYMPAGGDWTDVFSVDATAYAGEVWTLTTSAQGYDGSAANGNTTHPVAEIRVTYAPPLGDIIPPVITPIGEEPYVELRVGDTYTDAGATAADDVDGDVTASITTDNPVDTTKSWVYVVTYTATDAAGNEGKATRDVVVLPADDTRDYADETASDIEKIVQDAGCFINSVSADVERKSHSTMMILLIGLLLVYVTGYFTEKRFMKMLLVLLVGTGLLLGGSLAVHAQETEEAVRAEETEEEEKDVFTLEELVVTATKREMDIMDVPVAVSAFGHQKIEELGMTNKDDLEQLVPGLQFGEDTEFVGHGIVMRGIGSMQSAETHRDLAVAVYVDGIYTHSLTGVAPNLFDVERVEVGRGPQGTLHGRNSIAGSISFYTKKPTMEWDAEILAEFTDQVTERFNMAFGGPIVGGFSFRLTGGRFTGDGSQKNVGFAGDYGVPDETSISPQLRFKNDRFDINLRHSFLEDTGVPEINLMLWEPPRDVPYECSWTENAPNQAPDAFVNVRPGDFPGEIDGYAFDCFGTVSAPWTNWFLAEGRVPAVEDCGPGLANECDDLKNIVSLNRPGGKDLTRESWTLNADAKITEWLTLRYSYGESQLDHQNWLDGDQSNRVGSAEDPTISADGGVPYIDERQYSSYLTDGASHEIQLFSYLDGPLNFILGYYTYENYTYWEISNTDFGFPGFNVDNQARAEAAGFDSCEDAFPSDESNGHWGWEWGYPSRCDIASNAKVWNFSTDAHSETKAAFGSVDYEFNDQWRLSAGLRWTEDTRWRDNDLLWLQQELWDIAGTDDDSDDIVIVWIAREKAVIEGSNQRPSWDAWIWNTSLEYRPFEGTMIYGRISTGYRAGGFNSASTYNPPIEEETLINYELGLKGLFLDNRLNIRATGFYEDYNDYQILAQTMHPNPDQSMETPIVEFTDNIDGTYIYGLELESSYWINDSLSVSVMYAFTDSHLGTFGSVLWTDSEAVYDEWTYRNTSGDLVTTTYQWPRDFSGGRLPMQPKHKAAVTLSYDTPIDLLKGTVQLLSIWSYTGERYPYAQNVESQLMAAYDRLDLRARWTSYDQHWSVVLYVQNALDDVGLSEYLPDLSGSGYASGALTDPRQFGITLRWKW